MKNEEYREEFFNNPIAYEIQCLKKELKEKSTTITEKINKARMMRAEALCIDDEVNLLFIEKATITRRIKELEQEIEITRRINEIRRDRK